MYLHELDWFVKNELGAPRYMRYADDFLLVHADATVLRGWLERIGSFLRTRLLLDLHPKKVSIQSVYRGVDTLGYVILPGHTVLRTRTKHRAASRIIQAGRHMLAGEMSETAMGQVTQSYLGMLRHASAHRLADDWQNLAWFAAHG